jgi:hypothetical protein
MADFMNNLERINALAESAPGSCGGSRRQRQRNGAAADRRPHDGQHVGVDRRAIAVRVRVPHGPRRVHATPARMVRAHAEAYLVLWWVPAGHIPTTDEAVARLAHLREHGPTPHAFNFRSVFPPPDAPEAANPSRIDDTCPAPSRSAPR